MDLMCLYCENIVDEDELHFISDCCGRGMCQSCYDGDVGTMDQWQVSYMDDEDWNRLRPEFQNADYLCFECDIYRRPNLIKRLYFWLTGQTMPK